MSDISKEELEKEIEKILKNANLATTSTKKVRQQLEKKLGVNLTNKKKVIDQLVMDYVNSKEDDEQEEDGEEEEEEEEEDDKKKPAKRSAPPSKASSKKSKKDSSEEEEEEEEEDGTNESESEEEKKKSAPKKKGGKKKKWSDGDSDSDWGKAKATKASKKAGGRGKGGGYTRAYKLSPALSELMGASEMPRHEVVKRVWAMIKEKKLYDPNNKQFAICDDALYKVFGTKRFRTFGMMKYLKSHFIAD